MGGNFSTPLTPIDFYNENYYNIKNSGMLQMYRTQSFA